MAHVASQPGRVLSVFSLVMINVIAVDSLKTLPVGASYGFAVLGYYAFAALLFLFPTALVSAELATAWPYEGGIYAWVKHAFGPRWGFVVVWIQWIYNIIWYPTILNLVASTLVYLLSPSQAENKLLMFALIIGLYWVCTFVNFYGLRAMSYVASFGSLFGTLIPMACMIVLACAWVLSGKPLATEASWDALWPASSSLGDIGYMTPIIFGLMGLEMSCVHAQNVQNPSRDYPLALLISVTLILLSLSLASLAITLVVPVSELNVITGLIEAFRRFLVAFGLESMVIAIGMAIALGGMASVVTWIIGPTKGLLAACDDAPQLAFWQKRNMYDAPTRLLFLQGSIFTILCFAYLFMPGVQAAYWMLSTMTAQLALVMYMIMFAAAFALRLYHNNVHRPFRIPGGVIGMAIIAGSGFITSLAAILTGFVPPSRIQVGEGWFFIAVLLAAMLLVLMPAWFLGGYLETQRAARLKSSTSAS